MEEYLDITWENMSFYEKKVGDETVSDGQNWLEKRVVYSTIQETSEENTDKEEAQAEEEKKPEEAEDKE